MRRVMSCTYSIWDIIDDLVMRKVNDSDATKFAEISRYLTTPRTSILLKAGTAHTLVVHDARRTS